MKLKLKTAKPPPDRKKIAKQIDQGILLIFKRNIYKFLLICYNDIKLIPSAA